MLASKPAHVTGTEANVQRVHEALTRGSGVCCLRGIGGVGKSTTAWECVVARVFRLWVLVWGWALCAGGWRCC